MGAEAEGEVGQEGLIFCKLVVELRQDVAPMVTLCPGLLVSFIFFIYFFDICESGERARKFERVLVKEGDGGRHLRGNTRSHNGSLSHHTGVSAEIIAYLSFMLFLFTVKTVTFLPLPSPQCAF